MFTLSKLSAVEKDRYCQKVYEDYIFQTAEFLASCDEITVVLRTYIPSGCYTNFRDILFHFRCMANTNVESTILSQVASITEHANRAIRDAEVAICVRCVTIFKLLLRQYCLDDAAVDAIKRQIDVLQNWVLNLRLGSMMLEGMEILRPSNEDFLEMIYMYFSCAENFVPDEFKAVIAYAEQLKRRFSDRLKNLFNAREDSELRNFQAFATYDDVAELTYEATFDF